MIAHVYRLNPAYRLTPYSELSEVLQGKFADLTRDPGFYGLLHGADGERLPVRSASRDVAAILRTFEHACPAASVAALRDAPTPAAFLRKQLADAVLEVEHDGVFVGGLTALARLDAAALPAPARETHIQQLSARAVELAYRSQVSEPLELSARMYFYGRVPLGAKWRARFPDRPAVLDYLGLRADGRLAFDHDRRITHLAPSEADPAALFWSKWLITGSPRLDPQQRAVHKLYVSPRPDAMPSVLETVVSMLPESNARLFKCPTAVDGLLRPDKLVAYFADAADARAFGGALAETLADTPAHGVPFTTQIGPTGLVSLGTDPPATEHELAWRDRESWRLWLTNRLARAVLNTRKETPRDPLGLVYAAVALEGVDTRDWSPASSPWLSHKANES